jgi:hypothetical protein
MKTLQIFLFLFFISASNIIAQKTPIDKLFDKYAYKDGFSTVFISKHMFELFTSQNESNEDSEELKNAIIGLESIRVLTIEDSTLNSQINFFKEIGSQIPFDEYTTLMVVKEEDVDLRMMIKEKDGKIIEFLMLGGGDDDILISIMGNVNLSSISKISNAAIEMQEIKKD